jgi:hypothetical protein
MRGYGTSRLVGSPSTGHEPERSAGPQIISQAKAMISFPLILLPTVPLTARAAVHRAGGDRSLPNERVALSDAEETLGRTSIDFRFDRWCCRRFLGH